MALIPVRRYWQSFESGSLPGRSLPAPLAVLYCIFCFFAGWTNENTGFALPMMMAMFMAALWLTKRRIPRWMPVATLAALAGWIVLFTAPGNWVRMGITESGSSRLESLIQSLVSVTTILFKRYIPLGILCLAACLLYYWQHQRGWDRESWIAYIPTFIFAVGGVASAYAAVISPSFSARAWYGIVILLIITVGNSFALVTPDRRVYTLLLCTAILWAPKYAIDYKNGLEDVNASAAYWQWVGEEIEEAKANDVYEIVLPVHTPITSYSHAEYSSGDPDAWPNTTLAIHYGMDKISFSRDLDDPFQLTYDFT